MTKFELDHAKAMIKDYCDELIVEIEDLQTQLKDKENKLEEERNENEQLKQKLVELGVEI